jgi:hypothetical protein
MPMFIEKQPTDSPLKFLKIPAQAVGLGFSRYVPSIFNITVQPTLQRMAPNDLNDLSALRG